jgi:DNA repair protein RecO (recombination protein O)
LVARSRFTTDALVLRTVEYREADLMVTLFTRSLGKASALARGARRSYRRFGGALGIGARGLATLTSAGREGSYSLERLEVEDAHGNLSADVAALAEAACALELLREMTLENEAQGALFDLAASCLDDINRRGASEARRCWFAVRLLGLAGFGPRLDACAACGRPWTSGAACFFPRAGGLLCRRCSVGREGAVSLSDPAVRLLGSLSDSAAPPAEDLPAGRVRALVATAVDRTVEHHLGRPLRSRLFQAKVSSAPGRRGRGG